MGATPPLQAPAFEDEISLLEILNVLLKRWRTVIGLPVTTSLAVLGISFLVPPTYTATTSFVPEVRSQGRVPAALAGVAGQLGITLGAEASQSPEFYAQVLKSRELLDRVLLTPFADQRSAHNPPDSTPLYRLLEVGGDDFADSLYRARRKLEDRIDVAVDRQTGIVRLAVDARDPALAAAVTNAFVGYLNEFNAQTRQSQARERRKFVEARLAEVERDLRQAEDNLKTFYERNRSWQQSPQLIVEEDRRRRQVQIRQEVYLTLKREYETARIEEVNDTPVMTLIDPAVPTKERSKPRRRLLVALAFVLGGMIGVFGAFGAEYVDRVRRHDERAYREFRGLLQRLPSDLRSLVGLRSRRERRV